MDKLQSLAYAHKAIELIRSGVPMSHLAKLRNVSHVAELRLLRRQVGDAYGQAIIESYRARMRQAQDAGDLKRYRQVLRVAALKWPHMFVFPYKPRSLFKGLNSPNSSSPPKARKQAESSTDSPLAK